MNRIVALLLLAACTRSEDPPVVRDLPTPTARVPIDASTSVAPIQAPLPRRSEVGLVPEKTSRNRDVLAIGHPRFRLVPDCCDPLVIRVNAGRVIATDRNEVKEWSLSDGTLVRRESMSTSLSPLIEIAASADGTWTAVGDNVVQFRRQASLVATLKGFRLRGFVGSSAVLADSAEGPILADPMNGKVISRLPRNPFAAGAFTITLAGDGEQVWWITRRGFARWTTGASSFTIVTAGDEWRHAEVALRAPVAVVRRDDGLYRLDLETGGFKRFATRGVTYAVSPDGARCAIVDLHKIDVVDTTAGRVVATVASSNDSVHRVAFSENDNAFAFDDNGLIRIADIASSRIKIRPTPEGSRFRGWNRDSSASIEHEGSAHALDVATQAITPEREPLAIATRSPLSLKMTERTIVVTSNGKRVAKLELSDPPRPWPGLEQTYWRPVGSPDGSVVLAWIASPVIDRFPEPYETDADDLPRCRRDTDGNCVVEFVAQLWRVGSTPELVWDMTPKGKQYPSPWAHPKVPSVPGVFTPDGKFVLFGFDDGDVIVRSTDHTGTERTEALHRAPITRIEIAPNSAWVFTEDAEGEQRLWPL